MSSQSRKHLRTIPKPEPTSSLANIVADNDDLLFEILLRLPIKSLLTFKSICKHWLSLISSPQFSHFVKHSLEVEVLQSCNGLLLCSDYRGYPPYCVYNPTTKQYSVLPPLKSYESYHHVRGGVCLAFDPSKSLHYKVVFVRRSNFSYLIEIYSSENGQWRVSSFFTGYDFVELRSGVFWNGSVHWISDREKSLYFKVDEEEVRDMPMPSRDHVHHNVRNLRRRIDYFGEFRDHLHLIEIHGPRKLEFNVYEMRRDYSGWFVKYHVDLNAVCIAFPEIIQKYHPPDDWNYYSFQIVSVVTGKASGDSFLVLNICHKFVVRYNFEDKSFCKLYYPGYKASRRRERNKSPAFQLVDNLCCT
ncbi:F-box protein [Senna tora]|uniref:F-box protein n=1 Tax=Senna tora TaxID=362788 RepID=A0A834W700_9FABA|nr:F-box protein [Senna tora]